MIPEVRYENEIATLYVEGKPFFALSGEIHNSSSSSLAFMEKEVWPRLKEMHMNSVIVPLSWETMEPEEGRFDFALLEGLIKQAGENQMHLIFLWFGLWKNAESMYVPGWMKKDADTYFRAKKVNGEPLNTISPLCRAAVERDANAFSAVMKRIRELDGEKSTVIMMQVENEIGLLGTARDYSDAANRAFAGNVPGELAEKLGIREEGSWKETFGEDAEEAFMAYSFAKAVEQITAVGRKEYPLPCYTNAWLKQYPWYAGSYPSGGPVVEMQKIWRAAAPSLFTFAPDIYVPYVADTMDAYSSKGNPLFVPEVRKDSVTASYCLYAFGQHNAIGYSPFGIEDLALDPGEMDIPPMEVMMALNIDPSAFDIAGSREYLSRVYELMEQMKPLYLKYRGTEHLRSYVKKSDTDFGAFLRFENYDVQIAYAPKMQSQPIAAGMVYELEPNRFLVIGMQSTLTFMSKSGENKKTEILKMEEGELEGGTWKPGRILNGDEKMSLKMGDMASCRVVELYKY